MAACVWDHGGGHGPLSLFWEVVASLDGDVDDESKRAGTREGHLAELCHAAGLRDVEDDSLTITLEHTSFEDWWEPYTLGVGPAGDHVLGLDDEGRNRVIAACRARLPEPPFEISATAWTVRATRP